MKSSSVCHDGTNNWGKMNINGAYQTTAEQSNCSAPRSGTRKIRWRGAGRFYPWVFWLSGIGWRRKQGATTPSRSPARPADRWGWKDRQAPRAVRQGRKRGHYSEVRRWRHLWILGQALAAVSRPALRSPLWPIAIFYAMLLMGCGTTVD